MVHTTLVAPAEAQAHTGDPSWVFVDCRCSLADPEAGRGKYLEQTIRGAVHADLDRDLSAPVGDGTGGRHPLPAAEDAARTFATWGIAGGTQVVAFDDIGGGFAARLWWMLRWLGHDAVAVLDGGWAGWLAAGGATEPGTNARSDASFVAKRAASRALEADEVLAALSDERSTVIDARAAPRYRGELEPIDPEAGHIAGAHNLPWKDNLDADGRFLERDALRARFEPVLAGRNPEHAVVYCGSGVTACHDILAMTHAGLAGARLYVGSWSGWITDASRPRATGS